MENAMNMHTNKTEANLHNVHETLLLPLWGRAKAAEMESPVLKDAQAGRLVRQLDYDFSKFNTGIQDIHVLILAIRAKEMDGMIRDFIQLHPHATIVNIGAGLDTTFYRVNNGNIKWYDLDVPDVMNLRRTLLEPSAQVHPISKSMFDPSFLEEISEPEDGVLFLVSGVLMYFPEEQVRTFLATLVSRFPGGEAVFDTMTPFGMFAANRMIEQSGIAGAQMQWCISDVRDMERWQPKMTVLEHFPVCARTRSLLAWGLPTAFLISLSNRLPVDVLNHIRFA